MSRFDSWLMAVFAALLLFFGILVVFFGTVRLRGARRRYRIGTRSRSLPNRMRARSTARRRPRLRSNRDEDSQRIFKSNPVASVPFDEIHSGFIPAFEPYLRTRLDESVTRVRDHLSPSGPGKTEVFEKVEKMSLFAKEVIETANDDKFSTALRGLQDSVTSIASEVNAGSFIGIISAVSSTAQAQTVGDAAAGGAAAGHASVPSAGTVAGHAGGGTTGHAVAGTNAGHATAGTTAGHAAAGTTAGHAAAGTTASHTTAATAGHTAAASAGHTAAATTGHAAATTAGHAAAATATAGHAVAGATAGHVAAHSVGAAVLHVTGAALAPHIVLPALGIIATASALLACLKKSQQAGEFVRKLESGLELDRLSEVATFKTAYQIAQQQIASRHADVLELGQCRRDILWIKTMWLYRFQHEVRLAPPLDKKLNEFDLAIDEAGSYVSYALLATYIDFCICDVLGISAMFMGGLSDDIRSIASCRVLLASRLEGQKRQTPRTHKIVEALTQIESVLSDLRNMKV